MVVPALAYTVTWVETAATNVFVAFVATAVLDPAAELSGSVHVIVTEGRVDEVVAIWVRLIEMLIR